MGLEDVHMDESTGIKRALAWDDENLGGIGRGLNIPRVLRQDVHKIKCNLSLL